MTAKRDSQRKQDERVEDEQPKLEKETLKDLEAGGEQVKGGAPTTGRPTVTSQNGCPPT